MFDFDGVIADSLEIFRASLANTCSGQGIPAPCDSDIFLRIFDGNMIDGMKGLGVSADVLPAVLSGMGLRLANAMDRYPPFPGMPDVLAKLAADAPVYVITSNLTAVVRSYIDRYGIRGVRDVLGSDREPSKQAKISGLIAQWPGRQPVYVGDTLGDMEEAHAAGALAVAATWGWHDKARLQRGRPDHVALRPTDLLNLFKQRE